MVAEVQQYLALQGESQITVIGNTNQQAPLLLTTPAEIEQAAAGVVRLGLQAQTEQASAMMVAAFGDPGLAVLRAQVSVPVVGIGESAFMAAAHNGRRFGIVTITPDADLLASFSAKGHQLGVGKQYGGTWVTQGDAHQLLANHQQLDKALTGAIHLAIADGVAAVIIGGGPLSAAAQRLQPQFSIPLISPVVAAANAVLDKLN